MTNKDVLDYLRHEKECLLRLVGDDLSEFNIGRIYAMDKMISGVEGILLGMKNVPIEDLELSVRSYNCLKRNGVNSVDELLSKTTDDFMRMKNMGSKPLHEIEMKIEEVKNQYK